MKIAWRYGRQARLARLTALGLVLCLLVACTAAPGLESTPAPALAASPTLLPAATDTAMPMPTATSTPATLAAATNTAPAPSATLPPSATPLPSATPCPPDLCVHPALFLSRPLLPPDNDAIDISYRFGSTNRGAYDPHHGVEFPNPSGRVVVAAGDGVVAFAGPDLEPISPPGEWPAQFFGPYKNFYGNLVVIEHTPPPELLAARPDLPLPFYSLYAHLAQVDVTSGQQVQAGQPLGTIGASGISPGNHLHFEVRLGGLSYDDSRNPELWLRPHRGPDGQLLGALAGRILDRYDNSLSQESIVLVHLPEGENGPRGRQFSLLTYEDEALRGQLPWNESFAISDLPPGLYQVVFAMHGLRTEYVQVYPGQLTVVTFR